MRDGCVREVTILHLHLSNPQVGQKVSGSIIHGGNVVVASIVKIAIGVRHAGRTDVPVGKQGHRVRKLYGAFCELERLLKHSSE